MNNLLACLYVTAPLVCNTYNSTVSVTDIDEDTDFMSPMTPMAMTPITLISWKASMTPVVKAHNSFLQKFHLMQININKNKRGTYQSSNMCRNCMLLLVWGLYDNISHMATMLCNTHVIILTKYKVFCCIVTACYSSFIWIQTTHGWIMC